MRAIVSRRPRHTQVAEGRTYTPPSRSLDLLGGVPAEIVVQAALDDGRRRRCRRPRRPPRRARLRRRPAPSPRVGEHRGDPAHRHHVLDLDPRLGSSLASTERTAATSTATTTRRGVSLGRIRPRAAWAAEAAAAYSHSSSSPSGHAARRPSVTACAANGAGPIPPVGRRCSRSSAGWPGRRRGCSRPGPLRGGSRSSCGRAARAAGSSLALSTSSSSASVTHWPSTSRSGSASRSPVRPK